MRFVSATPTNSFSPLLCVEYCNDICVTAHDDGTVVLRDELSTPQMVWLNPGQTITSLVVFDDMVLIALDDLIIKKISLETGIIVGELSLPVPSNKFAVFEHVIVGFSNNQTGVTIIHRNSLEIIKVLDTFTFVVDVFAVHGEITVICNSHAYILHKETSTYSLGLIKTFEYLIIAAAVYNSSLILASPDSWRLVTVTKNPYEINEEFSVNSLHTLTKIKEITEGVIIESVENNYVFLKGNNIQLIAGHPDFDKKTTILTRNGIWTSENKFYGFKISQSGILSIVNTSCVMTLTNTKYLLGQTDPSITAIFGEYTGNENGEINGLKVLPAPILKIDSQYAYSTMGMVKLPVGPTNIIKQIPPTTRLRDSRIAIKVFDEPLTKDSSKWVGVSPDICLQPNIVEHAHIAVLHIIAGNLTPDSASSVISKDKRSIVSLENLVVFGCESGRERLYSASAKLLSIIWSTSRVKELFESGGPRSTRVLVSMAQICDIDKNVIRRTISKMLLSSSTSDYQTVLWVFEHQFSLVKSSPIPFRALRNIPEASINKFGKKMVEIDSLKLLNDAKEVIKSDNHQSDRIYAIKLLLAAVSCTSFPSTDEQTVLLVETVLPCLGSRVPGAKSLLTKLVATNRVQYHQGQQQKLLIATPHSRNCVAVVIDVPTHEKQTLLAVKSAKNQEVQPIFSPNGRTVMAAISGKRYAWHISKRFQLFHSDTVEPEEIN